jgi:thioredoxin reductase (NADPH)
MIYLRKIFICSIIFIFTTQCDNNLYDVIVIGAGPAGWSAAMEAARARVSVLVISGPIDGGQLSASHCVENIPAIKAQSGFAIMQDLREQALSAGANVLTDTVTAVDFSAKPLVIQPSQNGAFKAKAVIIATGSTSKKLDVQGEERFWGYGVSTCAVCDCFLYRDKQVVVVGGGDSAVDEALQLVEYASKITILVRNEAMRASNWMQEKLTKYADKITILYQVQVEEICGTDDLGVTGVQLKDIGTGIGSFLPVDGVFLAIGHEPNSHLFADWLPLDKYGYITLSTRSQATVIPGVFVAGDIADPIFKKAYIAMSTGGQAALEAVHFIRYQS